MSTRWPTVALLLVLSFATSVRATTVVYIVHPDYVVVAADGYAHDSAQLVSLSELFESEDVSKVIGFQAPADAEPSGGVVVTMGTGVFYPPQVEGDGRPPDPIAAAEVVLGALDPQAVRPYVRDSCGLEKPREPEAIPQLLHSCIGEAPQHMKTEIQILRASPTSLMRYVVRPSGIDPPRDGLLAPPPPGPYRKAKARQRIIYYGLTDSIHRLLRGRDLLFDVGATDSRLALAINERRSCRDEGFKKCLSSVVQEEYKTLSWPIYNRKHLLETVDQIRQNGKNVAFQEAYDKAFAATAETTQPYFDRIDTDLELLHTWRKLARKIRGRQRTRHHDIFTAFPMNIEYNELSAQEACRLAAILIELQARLMAFSSASPAGSALGSSVDNRRLPSQQVAPTLWILHRQGDEWFGSKQAWTEQGVCVSLHERPTIRWSSP